MTETRQLRLIASLWCQQYGTDAKAYIEDLHPSGQRHLVIIYEQGGYKDEPEFAAAIPDDWTEADIMELLLWPMAPTAPYPRWELSARVYGTETLFRWWADEKPT
jgi:hypothetical protein